MKREILDALIAAREAGQPVALVTHIERGDQVCVSGKGSTGDKGLATGLKDEIEHALHHDRSAPVDGPDGRVFIQVFNPPLRMIVVGAVHIAQPLVRMAVLADYEVTVVDPRRSFASEMRFPGVKVTTDWPDKAMAALAPDRRTAVVTLTHDPKVDDPALAVALRSKSFYIGSLGSRKTHAARVERLKAEGFTDAEIGRIHGPIGLDIGARSPAEIAISIMAELTRERRDAG